jgi:ABC-type nitrate/sulfonate/bicarbonate transport system substrate-binding protein
MCVNRKVTDQGPPLVRAGKMQARAARVASRRLASADLRPRFLAGLSAAVAAVLSLAACGGSSSSGTSTTASGKTPLVVVWNSPPDATYLPLLMAINSLKSQGYDISTETVSGADVATQALAANRAQFTTNQVAAEASAAAHGAPVKIIEATASNPAVWVTAQGYQNCSSLTGKPVGIFGPASASTYTKEMDYYFQKSCPSVKPTLVTIPDSGLRAQAMANGRIVASVLADSDALNLTQKLDPKHHYNVVSLTKTFPGLADTYLYANQNVVKSDPAAVAALVQADLQSVRKIYQNPSVLPSLLKKYYGTSSSAPTLASAQQAVSEKIWYANGGLDSAGMSGLVASMKVFKLPGSAGALVDKQPLDSALKQVGQSGLTSR